MKSFAIIFVSVFCFTASGALWAQHDGSTDLGRIVQVHDTSANPFILTHNGIEFGDPFPVYWDGVWHLYALRADLLEVLHFTSTDLVAWAEHEPAMLGEGIATGTVVRNDNQYYMFYTDAEPQTIRLVISDNPWRFDFTKSKLVVRADNKVYQLNKKKFRDCYIFQNEMEDLWWMLVEGTSDNAVAVGLFKSKDLLTWTQHNPIFKDKSRKHGSCPQLIEQAGRWYLTMLDYPTWYYLADTPYGPWRLQGFYHTKRMTAASRWASDNNRHLGWGFFTKHETPEGKNSGYGGPLGVGREMVFIDDGTIGVRPLPELVAAIHKPEGNADLFDCARNFRGDWEVDASKQEFRSTGKDSGVLLFDLPGKNPDYYFEADIIFSSPRAKADIVVRTSEQFDSGYRIVIDPENEIIAIRQFASDGGTFDEQEHVLSGTAPVHLQVFVSGGQIEAFVDGQTSLSTRVLERSAYRVAISIEGGRATVSKPLLHHFNYMEGE